MKKDLLEILCCPVCKGDLTLEVEKETKDDIITGMFTCTKCNCQYPIKEGIPDLLPRE